MFYVHPSCFHGVCFKHASTCCKPERHQLAHLVGRSAPATCVLLLHIHRRALQGRQRRQLLVAKSSTFGTQNQAVRMRSANVHDQSEQLSSTDRYVRQQAHVQLLRRLISLPHECVVGRS